jgi:hypothetical protein
VKILSGVLPGGYILVEEEPGKRRLQKVSAAELAALESNQPSPSAQGLFIAESRVDYDNRNPPVWFNHTGMRYLGKSPRHYLHWANSKKKPASDSQSFGIAAHALLLEGEDVFRRVVGRVGTDENGRAKRGETERILSEGKVPLKQRDIECLHAMRAEALRKPLERFIAHAPDDLRAVIGGYQTFGDLLADCRTELTCARAFAGTQVKCRLDAWHDGGVVLDYKTTARIENFAKDAAAYGYYRQAALYGDMAGGRWFVWLVQETAEPFEAVIYLAQEHALAQGRAEYEALCAIHAECVRTGVWPGIEDGFLDVPAWYARPAQRDEDLAPTGFYFSEFFDELISY